MKKLIIISAFFIFIIFGILLISSEDTITSTWNKVTTSVGSFFVKGSIDSKTGTVSKVEMYKFDTDSFNKLPANKEGEKYYTIMDVQNAIKSYEAEKPVIK